MGTMAVSVIRLMTADRTSRPEAEGAFRVHALGVGRTRVGTALALPALQTGLSSSTT